MEREKDRAKFVELAEKRVTRAIKDIRLIGNLSNKSNYSYTDQDVRKIIRALEAEIDIRLIGNLSNKSNYSYTDQDVRKIIRALEAEIKKLKQRFESRGTAEEIVFKL